MTKKQTKIEKIYVVVPAEVTDVYSQLSEAREKAKDRCRQYGDEYKILEVTGIWHVAIPEEPEPEVADEDLENLL